MADHRATAPRTSPHAGDKESVTISIEPRWDVRPGRILSTDLLWGNEEWAGFLHSQPHIIAFFFFTNLTLQVRHDKWTDRLHHKFRVFTTVSVSPQGAKPYPLSIFENCEIPHGLEYRVESK
ncbi:hypothetical protein RRG08_056092 [Elysia crispata]|uniref:Uncharacterized protein n=1 Tax=Elysia crispata TaxID=231223 RepID=A0AAE0ZBJ0_9GAST|nr:hypothetical protein RRG08_056092 [Elysia crispata]